MGICDVGYIPKVYPGGGTTGHGQVFVFNGAGVGTGTGAGAGAGTGAGAGVGAAAGTGDWVGTIVGVDAIIAPLLYPKPIPPP